MTIIPANPGFELLCGSIAAGKVDVYAPRPILAWRITEYGPIPIALDISFAGLELTPAAYISMALPEGGTPPLRYAVRHGGTIFDACIGGKFDSEEEWRQWLHTLAEGRWQKLEVSSSE